jgi:hypothetical protein
MEGKSATGLLQGSVDVAAVNSDSIEINYNGSARGQGSGCDIAQTTPCGSPQRHESFDVFNGVSAVHERSSSMLCQRSGVALGQVCVSSLAHESDSMECGFRVSKEDDVSPMLDEGVSPTVEAIHNPSTSYDNHSQSSLSTSVCKFVSTTINGVALLFNTVTKEYFIKLPKEQSDFFTKHYADI